MKDKSQRVLIAMSGGIDSSVASMLLLEQGYELVGVTYRTYDQISHACMEREKGCCSVDAIFEAKNLAKKLGFEHHILDLRDNFKTTIISQFIDEYLHGRTPNPCVECNSTIKWGKLIEFADEHNCGYIATGHYARIGNENGRYFLRKGKDTAKDQTYFLWKIAPEHLARTIFPLGNLTKPEVRKIALEHGFKKLSQKTESQEICFVTDNDYRHFLRENVDNYSKNYGEGNYVDINGTILGKHTGFPNYTIGQRKGLGIALGEPMYVVKIDAEKNQVILGHRQDLETQTCYAQRLNWMKIADFDDGMIVTAKIRYKSIPARAAIYHEPTGIRIVFEKPIESITPGQSIVFYNEEDMIGGGIISSKA